MTFIAGAYTATLNGDSLGIVEDGYELEITPSVEGIVGDNLGDSMQDGVFRCGNCFLSFVLEEFDAAGAAAAFWPFGAFGLTGTPGTLLSAYALPLVLTKITGPNATPSTLTATKAVLAPNFPVRMLFGSRLRRVPLRLQLLPYTSEGTRFFSTG